MNYGYEDIYHKVSKVNEFEDSYYDEELYNSEDS